MIIYNVTTQVTWAIHEAWLVWMQQHHIPAVMATGCFTHSRMARLLDTDETEGPTYTIQYEAPGREQYNDYLARFAPALRQQTIDAWGNQFIAFRTLMQLV